MLKYLQEKAGQVYVTPFDLTASPAGISLQIRASDSHDLYEIDLSKNKPLVTYFQKNAEKLDEYRQRELADGVKTFFREAAEIVKSEGDLTDELLKNLQRRVLVNSCIDVMGYHLDAFIGERSYRCLYQQGNRLVFLLPRGTKSFRLRGRTLPIGEQMVKAKYFVEVIDDADETKTEPVPSAP